MRISHRFKFIFIAKPKCGSSTVRWCLNQFSDIVSSNDQNSPYWNHVSASNLREFLGEEVWNSYFTFSTIRNPWDMVVSLYRFGKPDMQGRHFWHPNWDKTTSFHLPFKKFVLKQKGFSWMKYENFLGKNMQLVVRMEDFAIELPRVFERLKLPRIEIPHLNKNSIQVDYRKWYSTETRIVIAKCFEQDIDVGKYVF